VSVALRLPTFFVIGAAKAGTTSLNNYLAAHPEIAMTEPRELHLMVGPQWRDRVVEYDRHFATDAPIRGDCSPGYAVYPWNPIVSEHIHELVPSARLVYAVRDPVDRTIAYFAQATAAGEETKPPEEAIRPEDPDNYYVAGSRYATQVEVYLRRFDQERLLVVDQAHLRARRSEVLRRVFAHVGADPGFWERELELEYNVRGVDNVRLGAVGRGLRASRVNRFSRRVLPPAVRRRALAVVRRRLGRGAVYPEVSSELRMRLAEALAPEAERLRALTGQRFASWSV
jgi:sulfotransferase family protein